MASAVSELLKNFRSFFFHCFSFHKADEDVTQDDSDQISFRGDSTSITKSNRRKRYLQQNKPYSKEANNSNHPQVNNRFFKTTSISIPKQQHGLRNETPNRIDKTQTLEEYRLDEPFGVHSTEDLSSDYSSSTTTRRTFPQLNPVKPSYNKSNNDTSKEAFTDATVDMHSKSSNKTSNTIISFKLKSNSHEEASFSRHNNIHSLSNNKDGEKPQKQSKWSNFLNVTNTTGDDGEDLSSDEEE